MSGDLFTAFSLGLPRITLEPAMGDAAGQIIGGVMNIIEAREITLTGVGNLTVEVNRPAVTAASSLIAVGAMTATPG